MSAFEHDLTQRHSPLACITNPALADGARSKPASSSRGVKVQPDHLSAAFRMLSWSRRDAVPNIAMLWIVIGICETVQTSAQRRCTERQVGVVRVGQPFPFWRGATQLNLRVSAAVPADLVRLAAGSEVAVAPRPRQRPAAASGGGSVAVENGSATEQDAQQPGVKGTMTWLRVQVVCDVCQAFEGQSCCNATRLQRER